MKHILRLLAIAIAGTLLGFHLTPAQAQSKTSIELCGTNPAEDYLFALCAASTCTETGKRIAVNTPKGGKRYFKEVKCTCPVVNTKDVGPAIANVTGGNMQGSCARPNEATLWSLYSTVASFPQQSAGWRNLAARPQVCPKSVNQGREYSNCFSFKCDNIREQAVSGGGTIKVADCSCPKGEDVFSALPAAAATSFFTDAGGYNADGSEASKDQQLEACYQHPVGGF